MQMLFLLPLRTPLGTIVMHPVEKCSFKTNVVAYLLTLNPFVAQNLVLLGKEYLVQERSLNKGGVLVGETHSGLLMGWNVNAVNDFAQGFI